jgi:hypothetical protein
MKSQSRLRIRNRVNSCNLLFNAIFTVGIVSESMIPIDDYVVDVLMRDLVGHDRSPVSFLVYLWFTAEQQKRNAVEASYREIAESIGVSKSSAQAAVAWLLKRKLLTSTKTTVTATPRYKVLMPWRDHENRARNRP